MPKLLCRFLTQLIQDEFGGHWQRKWLTSFFGVD